MRRGANMSPNWHACWPKGPVHVHCIMNWRVTAFFYLLDLENGVPKREARARMATVWDPLASDDPHLAPWKALLSS